MSYLNHSNPSNESSGKIPFGLPSDKAHIVVLIGPTLCGKSMVLARLCNYLSKQRYSIRLDFTCDYSDPYLEHCVGSLCDGHTVMPATRQQYYFVRVIDEKMATKCHIVDTLGADYDVKTMPYNIEEGTRNPFPLYLDIIAASGRKVIYIIFLDYDDDDSLREAYISRMRRLYDRYIINTDSRVILLQNKVELFRDGSCANARGVFDKRALRDYAYQRYEDLFFKKKYFGGERITVDYVPFCTGTYSFDDNEYIYIPSDSSYPQMLWKTIKKAL